MTDLLNEITPDDALNIIQELSDDPVLRERILKVACRLLKNIDVDEVATDVFNSLDDIDVQELWDRAGPSRHGYSSTEEMAVEMVDEELEVHTNKLNQYLKSGLFEEATLYCKGVLKGLYTYEFESNSEFKDWAQDVPVECFGYLLGVWKKSISSVVLLGDMELFLKEECANWAKQD